MAFDDMISPYVNKMAHSEEVLELHRDLIKLDPPHSKYYKDQSSLVLLQQVNFPPHSKYGYFHQMVKKLS